MTLPLLHVGRAEHGTAVEDDCPCGQAPCGLVDTSRVADRCKVHGPSAAVDLLQHHRPGECPHLFRHPATAAHSQPLP
jgi:hypothetical protein